MRESSKMTKCGGYTYEIKGKPKLRSVWIPLPPGDCMHDYRMPAGCRLVSYSARNGKDGKIYCEMLIDITNEKFTPDEMPESWDFRELMREDGTPVRPPAVRR